MFVEPVSLSNPERKDQPSKVLIFCYFCLCLIGLYYDLCPAPLLLLRIFNGNYLTCTLPTAEKVIYLTFDDGPVEDVTSGVINILLERNIQATFFCVGDNVKKIPGYLPGYQLQDMPLETIHFII